MFEYIIGTITAIYPSYLVIEVGGIGYRLLMANPFRLTDKLETTEQLYVYQNTTQDDMTLFGFRTKSEKDVFLKLINVSGIGPKSALAILANEDHSGLIRAIEAEDRTYLQKFPGVGKKTAAQIILDLQGKLDDLSPTALANEAQSDKPKSAENLQLTEAIEALKALGYGKREVKKVKSHLIELEPMSTDEYIKEALRTLLYS
ncbi:Holliday junction branch migration protein RuvA [Dolosigranulum pigrum]|uniref:Holliday junction branch migration protein RuvA n=1 Tax=Dolosigranulum pigrum TaxID=29394 RepID=UPI000DC2E83B|nr:Holliday junction branch migration protein RuvA [Dolosigranulum pigrum]QTJ36066.1 Holliday junction branch migration protein RuvA [Dolosigranulum pigrum]RAN59741.1 Holliday junction branch migration protein RuvA [Dolosigranulum pigrum]